MRKKILFLAGMMACCSLAGAQEISKTWVADKGNGTYQNPVLHADYSDPDICAAGDDFYMTASSFNCIPGIPILHSNDLVNWSLVNYALPVQEPEPFFDKAQHGKGVWAPAIRFHNGEFYIYWGDPDYGIYMIKTKDPKGKWSKPVLVKAGKGMIDATPLWDEDGKVYLIHAYAGSRSGVNSILVICELNAEGTEVISDPVMVFDGNDGKNHTVEGPKLYKRNGYYYIFAPAGGVATGWQLVLRSKNIYGPYESKIVMAQGKTTINVVISYEASMIDEVVITAKKVVDKLLPEPTDIEIVGNQYIIHPKVKIPKEMYKPNTRIVVQPMLVNITRKTQSLFRPAVVTGKEYAITLERMMEFDLSRDPLAAFQEKTQKIDKNEVIAYVDSLYMDNPDDECRCDIYMYLVEYKKLAYKDTVVIAKGTVNPMRFFTYQADGMKIRDEKYIPKPQKQQRGDRGEVKLNFLINSATIDEKDPNNQRELEKMRLRLQEIETDPNSEFLSFSVKGVSSPEGPYQSNLKLAQKRTDSTLKRIFGFLNGGTINAIKDSTYTEGVVASWEEVAELMERDSLPTDKLREIINCYPDNMASQYSRILRLPEYRNVILTTYLPRLRRVEYSFNYSVMRLLNDEEIRIMYKQDYKKLVPYEFWRIYLNADNDSTREVICRQALEQYPKFMIMANELAALLIEQKKADSKLLEPFVSRSAPTELLCNQVIALMDERAYNRADSIIDFLPDNDMTQDVRAIVGAYNGHFEDAYERFGTQGGINEVVLLMAMKQNEEAWEKAQELPDEPLSYYLRAACANRLDKVSEAYAFIKRALNEDPSLKEIAQIDGDVTDLLQQLEDEKKELKEKAEKTKEKNETEDTETEESGLNEEKTIKQ